MVLHGILRMSGASATHNQKGHPLVHLFSVATDLAQPKAAMWTTAYLPTQPCCTESRRPGSSQYSFGPAPQTAPYLEVRFRHTVKLLRYDENLGRAGI